MLAPATSAAIARMSFDASLQERQIALSFAFASRPFPVPRVWSQWPCDDVNMLNCYETLMHLHEQKLSVEHVVSRYGKDMTVIIGPEELCLADLISML